MPVRRHPSAKPWSEGHSGHGMSNPLVPVLLVTGAWYYLHCQGVALRMIWITLNLLDTYRALRTLRGNGRRIGIRTRRLVMRESLVAWIVLVAAFSVGHVVESVIGWLPLYGTVKAIASIAFFSTRVASSRGIYDSFLVPLLKRYQTPIDLTLLLLHSFSTLIIHYLFQTPFSLVQGSLRATMLVARFLVLLPVRQAARAWGATRAKQPVEVVVIDEPDVDEDAQDEVLVLPRGMERSSIRSADATTKAVPSSAILKRADGTIHRPVTPPIVATSSNTLIPAFPTPLRRSPRRQRVTDSSSLLALREQSVMSVPALPSAASGAVAGPSRPPGQANASRLPSRTAPSVRPPNIPRSVSVTSSNAKTGKSALPSRQDDPTTKLVAGKVPHSRSTMTLGGSIARHSAKQPASTKGAISRSATTMSIYPSLPRPLVQRPSDRPDRLRLLPAADRTAQTRPAKDKLQRGRQMQQENVRVGQKRKAAGDVAEGGVERKKGRIDILTSRDP